MRCCLPAPSPLCLGSTTEARPRLVLVLRQLWGRLGSPRFSSMKTSQTLQMTSHCCILVGTFLVIRFLAVQCPDRVWGQPWDMSWQLRATLDRIRNSFNFSNLIDNQLTEERADLSVFSPACLPDIGESFLGQNGHVYGKGRSPKVWEYFTNIQIYAQDIHSVLHTQRLETHLAEISQKRRVRGSVRPWSY